jgi:hypothetical protein
MAMCQMDDTIIVTKAGDVPSVCALRQVLDVVYFDKEYARKATKLSEQCGGRPRPKMRAYLDRRNTTS